MLISHINRPCWAMGPLVCCAIHIDVLTLDWQDTWEARRGTDKRIFIRYAQLLPILLLFVCFGIYTSPTNRFPDQPPKVGKIFPDITGI